jgi:hypothetical protein
MTPIEIFEYKLKWLKESNNVVSFDEFIEYEVKNWCRKNLKQHQWHFTSYTDIYEHSVNFETEGMKEALEQYIEERRKK